MGAQEVGEGCDHAEKSVLHPKGVKALLRMGTALCYITNDPPLPHHSQDNGQKKREMGPYV